MDYALSIYGTTNDGFLHRKYCEQSKIFVLTHFFILQKFLKHLIWKPTKPEPEHLKYRYAYRLVLCIGTNRTIPIVNLTHRGIS